MSNEFSSLLLITHCIIELQNVEESDATDDDKNSKSWYPKNFKTNQKLNMAILNFQKPDKIILQKATDFEAQFEFRP
ncbi:MAG TPA: hypothetical protein VFD24_08975, partial [Chitinophagaceae bacterium]|nr:hypothetical protein [Chitinophagaceae bacterium]